MKKATTFEPKLWKETIKESRKEKDIVLVNILKTSKDQKAVNTAYKTLYKVYYPFLLKYMSRAVRNHEEAEDLAIQTLSRAFEKINSFNPVYAFSTWMQVVGRNIMIDSKRKSQLEVINIESMSNHNNDDDFTFEITDDKKTPVEDVVRQERHSELNEKLKQIPEMYSQVLTLRYFEELSYEEISVKLNTPLGTVKGMLFRARKMMNELYMNA